MNKRGQLTILIIISILIIGVIISIFLIIYNKENENKPAEISIRSINNQLESCLEGLSIDAVSLIGIHGGYAVFPQKEYENTDFGPVAYGLKNKKNILVSKETVEREIREYIEGGLFYCLSNKNNHGKVVFKKYEVDVIVKDDEVSIFAKIPFNLKKGEITVTSDKEYMISLPIRLGKIIDISHEIVLKQKNSGDEIPITYLSGFETNIVFDYYNNQTVLYMIYDEKSILGDISYSFIFLAELNKEESEQWNKRS